MVHSGACGWRLYRARCPRRRQRRARCEASGSRWPRAHLHPELWRRRRWAVQRDPRRQGWCQSGGTRVSDDLNSCLCFFVSLFLGPELEVKRSRKKGLEATTEQPCHRQKIQADHAPSTASAVKMGNTLDSTVFQPPKQSRYTDIPKKAKIWLCTKKNRKIAYVLLATKPTTRFMQRAHSLAQQLTQPLQRLPRRQRGRVYGPVFPWKCRRPGNAVSRGLLRVFLQSKRGLQSFLVEVEGARVGWGTLQLTPCQHPSPPPEPQLQLLCLRLRRIRALRWSAERERHFRCV